MGHSRSRGSRDQRNSHSIFPPPFGGGASYADESVHSPQGKCTAVIGSMTKAMQAQEALANAAIRAAVVKVSSSSSHNGCAYGVDFPCSQKQNVQTVLHRIGVSVRSYQ